MKKGVNQTILNSQRLWVHEGRVPRAVRYQIWFGRGIGGSNSDADDGDGNGNVNSDVVGW